MMQLCTTTDISQLWTRDGLLGMLVVINICVFAISLILLRMVANSESDSKSGEK